MKETHSNVRDRGIGRECLFADVSVVQFDPTVLVPETEPSAIAQAQRDAILEHVGDSPWEGISLEQLSHAVILPIDVVERRLHELGVRVWNGVARTEPGAIPSPRVPTAACRGRKLRPSAT